ncbi:putative membrane protein DUF2207 [Kribbella pratensis]|uniref:Membrane protein DUF2207 n=1 Tax=Kribbella pratensis TaxID=2512112 RepID=A0ABY2FK31_9ACTN|nr:DUF2207 domain-containing protein [Kribbella pratensis]TDW93478.1 putative membrane protein DUF2207 [Kribbella pratensis]
MLRARLPIPRLLRGTRLATAWDRETRSRALGVVISTLVAVLALAGFAVPASAGTADAGDEIKNFKIDYNVSADGVLHVTETIDYTFGSTGRHGIYRDLVTREPYKDDDSKDQVYQVSNIKVSSPSGAPDEFTEKTFESNKGRYKDLQIKIGSADETISGYEATYVIKYDVRGALRHFDDHSELYWDATGTAWSADIKQVDISVTVPGGVQKTDCFQGQAGSTQQCTSTVSGDQGVFGGTNLARGEGMTIVAGITAGAVQNDTPILVDPPSWLERNGVSRPSLIGSGFATVAAIVLAALYAKFGNKDQRYAGMPPGAFPPDGIAAQPVKDDLTEDQIPVAFAPPRIPVAEGGLLIDAKANTTETAATLIDLAVRGGVRIDNDGSSQKAVLLNPAAATAPHEQALMLGLYPGLQPGMEVQLERGAVGDNTMRNAHNEMIKALRDQVRAREWYLRMPRAGGGSAFKNGFGCACTAMIGIWVVGAGLMGTVVSAATGGLGRAVVVAVPVIAVIVAIGTWIAIRGRGQRNPAGRAVADQLIGFRKYLATAEADQLRFEEGEDIFSKYLPWAIAFGLADRWQKVCEQLVAAGRIPPDPYWYSGPSYYTSGWTAGAVGATVANTFSPPPTPSSSGGGGGSSSGFSGGSSGGGGGGGGGGSW